MGVKDRIKTFTKYMDITVLDFERSISVSNGYVNSISKSIGIDKIEIILEKYPNLNLIWLLTGQGTMLKDELETNNKDLNIILKNKRTKISETDLEQPPHVVANSSDTNIDWKGKFYVLLEENNKLLSEKINLMNKIEELKNENKELNIEVKMLKKGAKFGKESKYELSHSEA
ncbi:MAG: hypothetical protein LBJ72_02270 [Dysgonamonadaceae bacterium]|jgi:hypothetical protein|nr:hypothetical protein [Dysgonamonadaceae bacterium]